MINLRSVFVVFSALCSMTLAQEIPGPRLPDNLLPFINISPNKVQRAYGVVECTGCLANVELSTQVGVNDNANPGYFFAKRKLGGFDVLIYGWMGSGVCLGSQPTCHPGTACSIQHDLTVTLVGAPAGTTVVGYWGTTHVGVAGSGGGFKLPISYPGLDGAGYTEMLCGDDMPLLILTMDGNSSTLVNFTCSTCH